MPPTTPEVADGDGDAGTVLRRAPFSDNPQVGARGQRTQQRILDAALSVFGEVGYHQCTIDRIAKAAGCSRVSFYQYFSDKEDVFRRLATAVARQLDASTEWLGSVTADHAGWEALREWVERYKDIHDRYEPVFRTFPAAAESDAALAGASARIASRSVAGLRSRLAASELKPRELDDVVGLLLGALPRTLEDLGTLRRVAPDSFPDRAVLDAFTDVFHRSLFGLHPRVNAHSPRLPAPPRLRFGPGMLAALQDGDGGLPEHGRGPALTALLEAGRDVFVERGYHGTRIDDIATAAGVSHGTFYFYFPNKDRLALHLAAQAMRSLSATLTEIPDVADDGPAPTQALRRWLRAYKRAQAKEAAMIRVWVDASAHDPDVAADSTAAVEWGRRRMAQVLRARDFGDAQSEAVVLLCLVEAFARRDASPGALDAAVHVIETGFLGR